jgi:hypothetical protein
MVSAVEGAVLTPASWARSTATLYLQLYDQDLQNPTLAMSIAPRTSSPVVPLNPSFARIGSRQCRASLRRSRAGSVGASTANPEAAVVMLEKASIASPASWLPASLVHKRVRLLRAIAGLSREGSICGCFAAISGGSRSSWPGGISRARPLAD